MLYIRLYFGGVLFSVVYNMAAGILNAAGNSKRSLLYLALPPSPTSSSILVLSRRIAGWAWPVRPLPPISASWCPVCSPCVF